MVSKKKNPLFCFTFFIFAAAPAKRHKQDKQTELRGLVARSRVRGFDLAVA
jgi:hypothetical protein